MDKKIAAIKDSCSKSNFHIVRQFKNLTNSKSDNKYSISNSTSNSSDSEASHAAAAKEEKK
eukprot:15366814-Ditylum_brightwellii.AAC.3